MEFTKQEFANFRLDLKESLQKLEEKYGIKIKQGNISYSDYDFTIKLSCSKSDINVEQKEFEQYCVKYGFNTNDYNREFTWNGVIYSLVGFNPRKRDNKCLIQRKADGKRFCCGIDMVKGGFALSA